MQIDNGEPNLNRVIAVDKDSQKDLTGAAFVNADFTEQGFRKHLAKVLRNETASGKADVGESLLADLRCLFKLLISLG